MHKPTPVPYKLAETESGKTCVTTESMALLNAVLDRRCEHHPDTNLTLYNQGSVWSEAIPSVLKHQLGRRAEDK